MRIRPIIVLAGLLSLNAYADSAPTNQDARAILERVLAGRPTRDFSLKARLFADRNQDPVPVEILAKNTPDETRTIYRSGQSEALIVQPVHGAVQFFLRGRGELTGVQRTERLLGSQFTYYDLALTFLRWPHAKFLGEERVRGRDCFAIESTAEDEPYARVKIWIDKEYFALLRAEAYNKDGSTVRRFAVTSFKKIGELWVPHGMEASFVPPGQSLPSQEKSRLDIYEGDYGADLPAERFAMEKFGPASSGDKGATH
jgi:hypothetical protein